MTSPAGSPPSLFAALAARLSRATGGLVAPDKPRAELEARWLRGPDDYRDVAGLRLHVRDDGRRRGPTVVFLHGFGASLHTWEPWAEALSNAFRVVRYDLPGAGLTGADPTGDYSDGRGIAVLLALLDALRIGRASLVGHSVGGRVAWKFAARFPARVRRLVLVAPDGFATPVFRYTRPARFSPLFGVMRYALPRRILRATLATAYGNPATITEPLVDRYHDLLLAPGVRVASLARLAQTAVEDPRPALRTITTPTLIVWGGKDAIIPFAYAPRFLEAIPGSTLASFPDLGHLPHEEAPALTLPPVRAFLARRGSPTRS